MAVFQELIKNFDKIREYMWNFYVYGFKVRNDYKDKSGRTYDNERRRIESWLRDNITWEYDSRGKIVSICVDSKKVAFNPLYAVWKSKSFTNNDIMLHFLMLDILLENACSADEIADRLSRDYGGVFDVQTVRHKAKEYEQCGIVSSQKKEKKLLYSLSAQPLLALDSFSELVESMKFFQEAVPFGFIGHSILNEMRTENTKFRFKHSFMAHTLEDIILLHILECIREKRGMFFENRSRKKHSSTSVRLYGIPVKIQVSTQTGRRYVTVYYPKKRRFSNARLDYIQSITPGDRISYYDELIIKYEHMIKKCWGVSLASRPEWLFVKLYIDETSEAYIIERIKREGRGGELLHIEKNQYLYSVESYDANEIMSWVKTFIGRILVVECTNQSVADKFYADMDSLYDMYFKDINSNQYKKE